MNIKVKELTPSIEQAILNITVNLIIRKRLLFALMAEEDQCYPKIN